MTLNQFIEIMNGDLANEWTHLSFYLYHASSVAGPHAHEYKEFFTKAAESEMTHVQGFLDRLFGLNYDQPHQGPKTFQRASSVVNILMLAIKLEEEVVTNYTQRLKQLDELAVAHPEVAAYLKVFYEDQIQDSYEDCEHMHRLVQKRAD
jgi:bacterioferritin (cytochrome b1)